MEFEKFWSELNLPENKELLDKLEKHFNSNALEDIEHGDYWKHTPIKSKFSSLRYFASWAGDGTYVPIKYRSDFKTDYNYIEYTLACLILMNKLISFLSDKYFSGYNISCIGRKYQCAYVIFDNAKPPRRLTASICLWKKEEKGTFIRCLFKFMPFEDFEFGKGSKRFSELPFDITLFKNVERKPIHSQTFKKQNWNNLPAKLKDWVLAVDSE